jgi:hemoglobin
MEGHVMSTMTVLERPSLYEELGGAAAIEAVVTNFYERILGDPALSPIFAGIDMDHLRRHQARFVSFALGGPNQYTGRSMRRAHAGLNITEAQFGAVAGHLSDALAACGVAPLLVARVIEHVAQLAPEVIGQ